MEEPYSEAMPPPDPSAASGPDPWGRLRTRIALLVLHITILAAALALTPPNHAFELGYYLGSVLLFSPLFLWLLLYLARRRKPILVFCALALAQAGLMAFVGMRFRAQEAVLQHIMAEFMAESRHRQKDRETQMEPFRMGALFDSLSGKHPLLGQQLVELQARARAGKAKAEELRSETERWLAQAESRLGAVSRGAARDFRRGVDSAQPESEKTMKLVQDYFTEIEQLTGFLIDRLGRYRVTTEGLVFDKGEDAQAYNEKIAAVVCLEEKLDSSKQKAEELWREMPTPR